MKSGARTIGIAESYEGETSTLAAAVVRADRAVDGFSFDRCTVGGTDGTETVRSLVESLDREDGRAVLLAGIAPAWYNVVDIDSLADSLPYPVVSVSFEDSPGLEPALRREFSGDELRRRLSVYRRQPPRRPVTLNDDEVFVRASGIGADRAADLVRAFTPAGGRPEPLRVARLAARAADRFGESAAD